jgi:hypothetical protein
MELAAHGPETNLLAAAGERSVNNPSVTLPLAEAVAPLPRTEWRPPSGRPATGSASPGQRPGRTYSATESLRPRSAAAVGLGSCGDVGLSVTTADSRPLDN